MHNSHGEKLLSLGTKIIVDNEVYTIIDYDNSAHKDYSDYYVINRNGKKHYIHYSDVEKAKQ